MQKRHLLQRKPHQVTGTAALKECAYAATHLTGSPAWNYTFWLPCAYAAAHLTAHLALAGKRAYYCNDYSYYSATLMQNWSAGRVP